MSAHYLRQGFHVDATLSTWLQGHAEARPHGSALISASGTMTYGALAEQVRRFAGGLRELGIRQGDVVALQLPNSPEFVIAHLAIGSLGAITQTLHMPYRRAELEYLLADSGALAVICLTEFKDYSPANVVADISHDLSVIGVGPERDGAYTFKEVCECATPLNSMVSDSSLPFVLLYTSGTTAQPKGVLHTYRRFLGNADCAARELGITSTDRVLSVAPLSHLYGLFTLNITLAVGATSILLPGFSPASLMSLIAQHSVTSIFAGPAHFSSCLQSDVLSADALSNVRLLCLSGSPVSADLAEAVDGRLHNGKVIQLWGMTELQAGTYGRPSDPPKARFQTAGRPAPGMQLRVLDSKGQLVEDSTEGELQVTGAPVFEQYLNKPNETQQAFTADGWFKTGDLATVDTEGFLRITGRVKEIINRGGVKFNPLEVEEIIQGMPAVEACVIVPFEDEVLGERACLFVVSKQGADVSLDAVLKHLSSQGVAKFKWPERLERAENLPLTPTGKVMRGELAQRLSRSRDGPTVQAEDPS